MSCPRKTGLEVVMTSLQWSRRRGIGHGVCRTLWVPRILALRGEYFDKLPGLIV